MRKLLSIFLLLAFVLTVQPAGVLAQKQSVIEKFIETLEVGEPVYYESLTIIPIYATKVKDHTRYTTLDKALKRGWLKITELEGGSVPQVELTNRSDKYIYLMGGEILTGCKQDRIVGRDVLIRPKGKNIVVPVYCVEQGRWRYKSDKFFSKSNLGTYRMRSEAQEAKSVSQGNIWNRVLRQNESMGISSDTQNYQDAYEVPEIRKKIVAFERHMQDVPRMYEDTIGVVVGVGGKIVSVDIFVNPRLFKKLWPKILKSSALSAIEEANGAGITQQDAARFLRRLHDKKYSRKDAIDLGEEFSTTDRQVNVNALVYRNSVIHLAGFAQDTKQTGSKSSTNSERRIPVMRR